MLGAFLLPGRGVEKNEGEGGQWLRRAAEAGVPLAQLHLGRMYERGVAVEVDLVNAHRWYSLAAASGEPGAAEERDRVARKLSPEQLARSQALRRQ
jgi:TPR repeat protein